MLVLSRKYSERVLLKFEDKTGTEKEVTIQIVGIENKKVRLGIDADKSVTILRQELLTKKKKEPVAVS